MKNLQNKSSCFDQHWPFYFKTALKLRNLHSVGLLRYIYSRLKAGEVVGKPWALLGSSTLREVYYTAWQLFVKRKKEKRKTEVNTNLTAVGWNTNQRNKSSFPDGGFSLLPNGSVPAPPTFTVPSSFLLGIEIITYQSQGVTDKPNSHLTPVYLFLNCHCIFLHKRTLEKKILSK